MKTEESAEVIRGLEDRVSSLERQVFGNDLHSKIQQGRKVTDEILQINGQIQRAVSHKDVVSQLMKQIEEIMGFLELEESSQLLGGEAKANAILTAEPLIRQMHDLINRINMDQVQEAINSEAIRNLTSMTGQLAKLKVVQMDQEDRYAELCTRIRGIEEAVSILISNSSGLGV